MSTFSLGVSTINKERRNARRAVNRFAVLSLIFSFLGVTAVVMVVAVITAVLQ